MIAIAFFLHLLYFQTFASKWNNYQIFLPITESDIDGIYNTILVKDVAKREGITDITLSESIVKVMASSIGSPISTKKAAIP